MPRVRRVGLKPQESCQGGQSSNDLSPGQSKFFGLGTGENRKDPDTLDPAPAGDKGGTDKIKPDHQGTTELAR